MLKVGGGAIRKPVQIELRYWIGKIRYIAIEKGNMYIIFGQGEGML